MSAKHTPWKYVTEGVHVVDTKEGHPIADIRGWGWLTGRGGGACALSEGEAREIQNGWGQLIAAASNSYRKNCGPRAVECAEKDLLGEALKAVHIARSWLQAAVDDGIHRDRAHADLQLLDAVLAKTGGK